MHNLNMKLLLVTTIFAAVLAQEFYDFTEFESESRLLDSDDVKARFNIQEKEYPPVTPHLSFQIRRQLS